MRLYVLLSQGECRVPLLQAAAAVIRGGADVVQLREKELPDQEVVALARSLRRMSADAGVTLIMNDRADLARLTDADGVHLGQDDLPVSAARKTLAPGQIVGVSTHSVEQAQRAEADGADYIGVGPVFSTQTRGYVEGVGTDYVRQAAAAVSLPLIAIGGITLETAGEVIAAGAPGRTGIAVCSAILGAEDIESATREFRRIVDEAARV